MKERRYRTEVAQKLLDGGEEPMRKRRRKEEVSEAMLCSSQHLMQPTHFPFRRLSRAVGQSLSLHLVTVRPQTKLCPL